MEKRNIGSGSASHLQSRCVKLRNGKARIGQTSLRMFFVRKSSDLNMGRVCAVLSRRTKPKETPERLCLWQVTLESWDPQKKKKSVFLEPQICRRVRIEEERRREERTKGGLKAVFVPLPIGMSKKNTVDKEDWQEKIGKRL